MTYWAKTTKGNLINLAHLKSIDKPKLIGNYWHIQYESIDAKPSSWKYATEDRANKAFIKMEELLFKNNSFNLLE